MHSAARNKAHSGARLTACSMAHSTVTKKGQTTIPSEIRRALKIKPGDRLEYAIEGERVSIRIQPGAAALKGALAGSIGRDLTFGQIREAAAEARRKSWKK